MLTQIQRLPTTTAIFLFLIAIPLHVQGSRIIISVGKILGIVKLFEGKGSGLLGQRGSG